MTYNLAMDALTLLCAKKRNEFPSIDRMLVPIREIVVTEDLKTLSVTLFIILKIIFVII